MCENVCVCVWMSICKWKCKCANVWIWMCVRVYGCVHGWVCEYESMWLWMFECRSIWVSECVSMRVCKLVYVWMLYECECVWICTYMCAYVHMCICACVDMFWVDAHKHLEHSATPCSLWCSLQWEGCLWAAMLPWGPCCIPTLHFTLSPSFSRHLCALRIHNVSIISVAELKPASFWFSDLST